MARPKLQAKTKLVDGVRVNIADETVAAPSSREQGKRIENRGLEVGKKYTPTVISDTSIRESEIPRIKADANQLLAPQGTAANPGQEPQGTSGTSGVSETETGTDEYSQLYSSIMGSAPGGEDPLYDAELNMLDNMQKSSDATTQAYIKSLSDVYNARRAETKAATAGGRGAAQTMLMSGGGYRSGSSASLLSGIERAGIRQLSTLDAEEQQLKASALADQQTANYKNLGEKLDLLKEKRAEKLETVANMWDEIVKERDQTQKDINDVMKDAAKSGAPKEVRDAIMNSRNVQEAMDAAGSYLATGTGIIGEYQYYKREAEAMGQTPVDFQTYQDMDANRKRQVVNISQNPDRILTIAEAQTFNVPFGTTASQVMGVVPTKPPTEGQSITGTYAARIVDAGAYLNNLEGYVTSANPFVFAGQVGIEDTGVGSAFVEPEIRQVRQAERNFLNSVLRRESGAVISPTEFSNGVKQYFPRPGDDPQTLMQKKQNRETVTRQFITGSGSAYVPPDQTATEIIIQNQTNPAALTPVSGSSTNNPAGL